MSKKILKTSDFNNPNQNKIILNLIENLRIKHNSDL